MEEIVKSFFLWKPLDRNLLHDVITKVLESDPSLENFQHRLLDRTTKSDTFQQFPVHSESKSYFFQTLLALLEKFKVDILDDTGGVWLDTWDEHRRTRFVLLYARPDQSICR